MSDYPPDWRVLPLGEVAEVAGGGTPSRDVPAFWENDHYWITPSEVVTKDGKTVDRSKERISNLGLQSSGAKLHPPGTILMTSRASIGFAVITKEKISTNQGFQSLRCGGELDNWFALHQIRHRRAELQQLAAGSTFLEVSGSNVRSFPFIVPPLPEQKKIAEILSGIDNAIASAIKEKQHREKMRRSAVKQLTRGASHKGQRKDSGTEFGMIPAHWECQPIPICCTIENSKRQPIKKEERATMRGNYPYHGATRIQDYISKYAYEGEYVLIGEDGDHFSKYNDWEMAQYATGRFNVSNHAHVIRGASNCSTQWLYYSLLHRDLTYHLTRQGATRFKLSKASLECIPVLLPPPEEQVQMVDAFNSMTDSISILSNRVIKLQALKTALSSDLLSGRKRVSV